MEIRKRIAKVAAFTLTAGAVTVGGLGFGGIASADNGSAPTPPARTNTAAPANQPAGGNFRTDMMSLAAKKIGVSVETLRSDMARGRSIQQIAVQHGVAYSDLKTTLVDAEGAALQNATAAGKVTQTEANQEVSLIPQKIESFLTRITRTARTGPTLQGPQGFGGNFGNRTQGAPGAGFPGQGGPGMGGQTQGRPMTPR